MTGQALPRSGTRPLPPAGRTSHSPSWAWGSPSSMRGRPDRLAFSRCSTARLLRMRRARATKGAEWSSRGVLRASRYCRQLVCRGRGNRGEALAQACPSTPGPRTCGPTSQRATKPQLSSGYVAWFYNGGNCGWGGKAQSGVSWVSEAGLVAASIPNSCVAGRFPDSPNPSLHPAFTQE